MECPIDFTDPAVQADPFPVYEQLRGAQACRDPKTGIWQIFGYGDVANAARDVARLSNRSANQMLPTGELAAEIDRIYNETSVCPMELLVGDDAPTHTYHRSLIDKAFTLTRVRKMEGYLQTLVDEVIETLRGRDAFEVVMEFAMIIPSSVIADQMGVGREDILLFRQWSDAVMENVKPDLNPARKIELAYVLRDFHAFLQRTAADYRANPQDNLLSDLVHTSHEGRHLSDRELVTIVRQMMVAGIESTANALASGIHMLATDSKLQAELRADPALVPAFVEEVLRLESPFQGLFRRAKEDVVIGDVTIPAGAMVMLRWGSANRDPAQFADPDEVVLDRPNGRQHVTFGAGAHFCIGNQLARGELRIGLEALLRETRSFKLAPGDSVVRLPHYFIRGFEALRLAAVWA